MSKACRNLFVLRGRLQGNREYSVMALKVTGSSEPSQLPDPCFHEPTKRERQRPVGGPPEPKQPW